VMMRRQLLNLKELSEADFAGQSVTRATGS
jgi:hypothetical protein